MALPRMLPLLATSLVACADEPVDLLACEPPELYRITRVDLPESDADEKAMGFDLDGDEVVDNVLGEVSSAVRSQLRPFDLEGAIARHLATVEWSLSTRACGEHVVLTAGNVRAPLAAELVGDATGDGLVAHGGGSRVPLSLLWDVDATFPDAGWLTSMRSRIELVRTPDGLSGRLGVALDAAGAMDAILPPALAMLEQFLPPRYRAVFDKNNDGTITVEELRSSDLVQALLESDLRVGDVPAISLGLHLEATPL